MGANNPRGLTLGQTITAKRTCSVVYEGDYKVLVYHEVPFTGVVIGSEKKALGKYVRGGGGYFDLEDYEEPRLKVSRYVWLYAVRNGFGGLQSMVHPEDIE